MHAENPENFAARRPENSARGPGVYTVSLQVITVLRPLRGPIRGLQEIERDFQRIPGRAAP
jgi:hypothetical protein